MFRGVITIDLFISSFHRRDLSLGTRFLLGFLHPFVDWLTDAHILLAYPLVLQNERVI